jgi:HEAT repeat protein
MISGVTYILSIGLAWAQPTVQPKAPTEPALPAAKTAPATAAAPAAAVQAEALSTVNELLNAFETIPSEEDWKKLGPNAGPVLRQVALDKTTVVTRRKRAITGLVYFGDDATKGVLKGLVGNEAESYRIRGQAALSLALVAGVDAVGDLTPLLAAPKHRLREATIKAFARIDSDAVVAPLKARLSIEPKTYLKEAITAIIEKRSASQVKDAPAVPGVK